ncbi:MAG TPA: hypothetical protein VFQ22_13755 [Longimicrobiales bacterium]|nr:hypothetical protein [Longimicrobiales bacterium]
MHREIISQDSALVVRRQVLEPGEAMPWHTDPCRRFTVVVGGNGLAIEIRETGERIPVAVHPGLAEWDEPKTRVQCGVNVGSEPYEEMVLFFLPTPGADPQPEVE